MNIRLLLLGVATTALLASSPAQAQKRSMFITVDELSVDCAGAQEICLGFIVGVADALEATAWPAKRSCRGNKVQLQEVVERALELLEGPPVNMADSPAFDYLAEAYVDRWPC